MIEIKLWQIRVDRELSLTKLEKISGISRSTINRIENGSTSPNLEQLEVLAISLKCRITDLFESDYK